MEKIMIYTDGGARGNPGPGAIAFVVYREGKIIREFSKKIGRTTNNVAEYTALLEALKWLEKNQSLEDLKNNLDYDFYSDSQLVVNQLKGIFKIKDLKLKKIVIEIKELERKIDKKINYHLVRREKNKRADTLVNQSLDE